jgi:hypothetical protein
VQGCNSLCNNLYSRSPRPCTCKQQNLSHAHTITMAKVILVTGGTGLVGNGIRASVERDGPVAGEEFIFLSSKDCNLL